MHILFLFVLQQNLKQKQPTVYKIIYPNFFGLIVQCLLSTCMLCGEECVWETLKNYAL